MSAYEITVVVVLVVIFILLSLLPFINSEEDLKMDDLNDKNPDLPPSWVVVHRH